MQHDPLLADPAQFRVRSADRTEASIPCTIVLVDGAECAGEIRNLSPGGALLAPAEPMAVGCFVVLRFAGDESVSAEVKWSDGEQCGCRFPRTLTVRQYLRLRQGPAFDTPPPEKSGLIEKLRGLLLRKG